MVKQVVGGHYDEIEWDEQSLKASYRLGELELSDDEILQPGGVDSLDWDEEIEEATGNEGATAERQYSGAGILVYARQDIMSIMVEGSGWDHASEEFRNAAHKYLSNQALDDFEKTLVKLRADFVHHLKETKDVSGKAISNVCEGLADFVRFDGKFSLSDDFIQKYQK